MNDDARRVHARIDRLRPELLRFLKRFCAIATVYPPGDRYRDCVDFLRGKLDAIPPTLDPSRVTRRVGA